MVFHDFPLSEDNSDRYFDDFEQILFNFDKNLIFLKNFFTVLLKMFSYEKLTLWGWMDVILAEIFFWWKFSFSQNFWSNLCWEMQIFRVKSQNVLQNRHPPTQMWPEILEKMKIFVKKIFPAILRPLIPKVSIFHRKTFLATLWKSFSKKLKFFWKSLLKSWFWTKSGPESIGFWQNIIRKSWNCMFWSI